MGRGKGTYFSCFNTSSFETELGMWKGEATVYESLLCILWWTIHTHTLVKKNSTRHPSIHPALYEPTLRCRPALKMKITLFAINSCVAQRKRAGLITRRSLDRNESLLIIGFSFFSLLLLCYSNCDSPLFCHLPQSFPLSPILQLFKTCKYLVSCALIGNDIYSPTGFFRKAHM